MSSCTGARSASGPLAPTIDANGITAPTYADVFASRQDLCRSIYGADTYLEADSQDG
ncbi:hypothetical protein [Burkholderia sp. TSV86]|uniref:hypothetical protein n=1 Tax=Burkholderia sp. TSV86 TaxID=1385594 RepID=UPI000A7725C4|nr:hypothetical protein [Burkholderia sp. TSV86]